MFVKFGVCFSHSKQKTVVVVDCSEARDGGLLASWQRMNCVFVCLCVLQSCCGRWLSFFTNKCAVAL